MNSPSDLGGQAVGCDSLTAFAAWADAGLRPTMVSRRRYYWDTVRGFLFGRGLTAALGEDFCVPMPSRRPLLSADKLFPSPGGSHGTWLLGTVLFPAC